MAWTFDSTPHLYRLNGDIVPSVTDICDDEPIPYGDDGGSWGQAIHHATLAFDLGAYHHDDYPPFVGPHIDVYQTWLMAYRPRWIRLEQPRVHPAGFGGMADRLGILGMLRRRFESIVDLKTSGVVKWHGWQTAGYDYLHDNFPLHVRRRYALYLGPEHFRFLEHTKRADYHEFVQRARQMGVRL